MTRAALLLACAVACSEPPAEVGLTLARDYDAVGVVRVFPDGLTPTFLDTFAVSISSLQVSGGRAVGQAQRRGGSAAAIALSGTFDEEEGQVQFDPTTGALTATRTESISIAGVAEDGFPEDDGVADDLTGFLRTEIDLEVRQGQFLAVSRHDRRPAAIDEEKVTATDQNNGKVDVRGSAGAAIGSVGVEILRFTIDRADPDFVVIEAEADGSFAVTVTGIAGDVFLIRNSPAGHRSDARFVRVD